MSTPVISADAAQCLNQKVQQLIDSRLFLCCNYEPTVSYAIIGEQCDIEENVTIGARPEDCLGEDWGISVVGHKKTIPSGTVIKPKEIV